MNENQKAHMAGRIRNGNDITGRALEIVGEIYAKQYGRTGSKGYQEALNEFEHKIGCGITMNEQYREHRMFT